MRHLRLTAFVVGVLATVALVAAPPAFSLTAYEQSLANLTWQNSGPSYQRSKDSCGSSRDLCTEVARPEQYWGNHYVGHDEPSILFYSKQPGSGNNMTYQLTLPREPAGGYSKAKSYDFELTPAFWVGMALCDNFSYPQTVPTCTPDSDSNAVNVATSTHHPGAAYMELQFYPPGWIPQWANTSCDPRAWCAALTIDSLSVNPVAGTMLNTTCQNEISGGLEYVNFAYLTHNGEPQGPPNPVEFDPLVSGVPGPHVLYMNPGDKLTVSLHDSLDGLVTRVVDNTSHQSGFMTASAGNGFGHIVPAPHGTGCHLKYYNFHPMYSTSQPNTTVPWAAATYNVAIDTEVGHFDFCTHIDANSPVGGCNGLEGGAGNREVADGDDAFCFPAAESLRYPVTGCVDSNDPGFDGPSYVRDWPNGKPTHPTPMLFSSPLIGGKTRYSQAAFNTDLPAIETPDIGGKCDVVTGRRCTDPPPTDDGAPAFYPYYSTVSSSGGCRWAIGNLAGVPGTTNSFGATAKSEYGPLQRQRGYVFNGGGATQVVYLDFQRTLPNNPC
ncbi:MAG TPA: hypothetical protein VE983_11485 [Solirubrobacteraceae bacterium]|nr:hypothetical protein [Solirubrobacteraceae bacterium]